MDVFGCPGCEQVVFFGNTACLRCRTPLAFDPAALDVVVDEPSRRCADHQVARCNWLTTDDRARCRSCQLTRARPQEGETALGRYVTAEAAKRRLVFLLLSLGLPLEPRDEARGSGVAFDLLDSSTTRVMTGHAAGIITLDLAESDDAHRVMVRQKMSEPYRTVLGHFRHEIGHYYFPILIGDADRAEVRALFGDETIDYRAALERHYRHGAPAGWSDSHVSEYATMHPAEDWAECFAHYLHIRASLQTAGAYGLRVDGPDATRRPAQRLRSDPARMDPSSIERIIATWLPLSYALNAVSRSMGDDDLYPFVLSPPVIAKLGLIHRAVQRASAPRS
jgi:hypothetical protein